MIRLNWKLGLTLQKDPDSVEEYLFDASNLLESDTISDVTIIDDGVTGTYVADSSEVITFRVSGGTAGNTGSVTIRITTASSQIFDRTIYYYIVEQ